MFRPPEFKIDGAGIGDDEAQWRRSASETWPHDTRNLDKWNAVEVIDGTPGPDGQRKHYVLPVPTNLRSAREAVAWTYGLSSAQYAELNLRT